MKKSEVQDLDSHSRNETSIIVTTIKTKTGEKVSVETDKPIPKELMLECMREINDIEIELPVIIGDIILENILNTGINIVATQNTY